MEKSYQLTFYLSELKQCRYILDNNSIQNRVALFLLKYVSIEAFYKKLLIFEKESKGKKLSKKDKKNLRVVSSDVHRVLQHFKVEYDEELIERIFGSCDNNYMDCSVKKLRDRLVHNMNGNVLKVALERYEQINRDLDAFLDLFNSVKCD